VYDLGSLQSGGLCLYCYSW